MAWGKSLPNPLEIFQINQSTENTARVRLVQPHNNRVNILKQIHRDRLILRELIVTTPIEITRGEYFRVFNVTINVTQ